MRRSLEQVQGGQGAGAERGEGGEVERLRAENRALLKEKRSVQADNHRQTVELCRLQEENSRLTREAKETRERVFALESERAHVQPQLARARSLQEKVTALERELLVLDRLYHRQREETHSLLAQGKREQEWTMLTSTLRKEKEAAERERASLLQEIEGLKIVVASLREEGQRAEEEKAVLQQILQHVQGRCQEKIKVCAQNEGRASVQSQL
jgi:chromosome segregation ATPase